MQLHTNGIRDCADAIRLIVAWFPLAVANVFFWLDSNILNSTGVSVSSDDGGFEMVFPAGGQYEY